MKSSSINNTIEFSLNITAHASYKATQNTRGHHGRPRTQRTIYTHAEGRLNTPINKALCDQCVPSACVQDFEEKALSSTPTPGEQTTAQDKYSADSPYAPPPSKKNINLKYLCAYYRANQYFSSAALIVHAGLERL